MALVLFSYLMKYYLFSRKDFLLLLLLLPSSFAVERITELVLHTQVLETETRSLLLILAVYLLVYRRNKVSCIPRLSFNNQATKMQQTDKVSDRISIPYHGKKLKCN